MSEPLQPARLRSGEYVLRDPSGRTIAHVVMTGERSRDTYPWSWWFADDVKLIGCSHTGSAATMGEAIDVAAGRWEQYPHEPLRED